MRARMLFLLVAALGLTAVLAGCGGSSKSSNSTTTSSTSAGAAGGTFLSVAKGAPSGSPDPQINYTLQEWQLLIFTHDGLVESFDVRAAVILRGQDAVMLELDHRLLYRHAAES